jgi:hypothetical protein
MTASDGSHEAERATDILREAITGGDVQTEPALDPLRARPDFQVLMMDAAYPVDPSAP